MKFPKYQKGIIHPIGFWTSTTVTYTLSGTSGSPNVTSDTQVFPDDAVAGWIFHADGRVQQFPGTFFNQGTEWTNEYPSSPNNTWIRATLESGSDAVDGNSASTNTWLSLGGGSNRRWTWETTGLGTTAGTVYIEISTDSSGSPVVASGYYRGNAVVNNE